MARWLSLCFSWHGELEFSFRFALGFPSFTSSWGLGRQRPRVTMVRRIVAVVVPGSLLQLTRFHKALRSSKRCLKVRHMNAARGILPNHCDQICLPLFSIEQHIVLMSVACRKYA